MSKIKKFFVMLIMFFVVVSLASCGKSSAKIEIINVTPMRTSIGVTLIVTDEDEEITEGSLSAEVYEYIDDEEYLVDVVTFSETETDEQTLTIDDLDKVTKYRVVVSATIKEKKKIFYRENVTTVEIGNEANPIEISTKEQLLDIKKDTTAYYKLTADIDFLAGSTSTDKPKVEPIFTSNAPFKGNFDGNGKTISNFMQDRVTSYLGLFGYLEKEATVKNLKIANAAIKLTKSSELYVGMLAGYNAGVIENVTVDNCSLDITGSSTSLHYIGGLVGVNVYKINDSKVLNTKITSVTRKQVTIGGLVASHGGVTHPSLYGALIDNCEVDVTIDSKIKNITKPDENFEMFQNVGGFVGEARMPIKNSVSKAVLTVTAEKYASSLPKTYVSSVGGFAAKLINGATLDKVIAVSTISYISADIYQGYIGTLVGKSVDGIILNSGAISLGENNVSITTEKKPIEDDEEEETETPTGEETGEEETEKDPLADIELEKLFALIAKTDDQLTGVSRVENTVVIVIPTCKDGSIAFDGTVGTLDLTGFPQNIIDFINANK